MFNAIASFAAGLIPQAIKDACKPALDKIEALLQGEPARAIGYGAAVVVYLVAAAFNRIPDVSFNEAVADSTAAIALLVSVIELIRHYVYSPASAAALIDAATPADVGAGQG